MAADPSNAIAIFYCYAHADKALLDELEKHLSALNRQGQISGWHDRNIQAGQAWEHEIDTRLNTADIILLLVSPDFMSSEYCYSTEMRRALERHQAGEARIIPIILRPVDWEGTPISILQVLPEGGKAITLWPNRDQAFWDVAREIREVVRALLSQKAGEQGNSEDTLRLLNQHHNEEKAADRHITHTAYPIINTKEAVNLFHQLMQSNTQTKVLRLVGEGKMGKSYLVTKVFPTLARQDYQARCVVLDLRSPVHTIPDLLHAASTQLGSQVCDSFTAAYEMWTNRPISQRESIENVHHRNYQLTAHLVKDLSQLDDIPLLLLFDSVSSATKTMQTWLMNILLTQIFLLSNIRVVMAGRSLPETHGSYATFCRTYRLLQVTDEEAYIDYCQRLNARVGEQSIRDFAYACDYIPGLFADLILPRFVPQGVDHG